MNIYQTTQKYWNQFDENESILFGTYGMGGGGKCEISYRHFFELKHLLKLVDFNKDMSVLELGSGNGRWSFSLAAFVKKYTAVDFSAEAVEFANALVVEKNIKNLTFINSSLMDFQSNEQFDIIYFSSVSQYITDEDMRQILERLRPCLKQNTIIIDRSTINFIQREIIDTGDYYSIYRTPQEIISLFEKIEYDCVYQKRSYLFLRCTSMLKHHFIRARVLKLINKFNPSFLWCMYFISYIADIVWPVTFENGQRSHDFFVFKRMKDK